MIVDLPGGFDDGIFDTANKSSMSNREFSFDLSDQSDPKIIVANTTVMDSISFMERLLDIYLEYGTERIDVPDDNLFVKDLMDHFDDYEDTELDPLIHYVPGGLLPTDYDDCDLSQACLPSAQDYSSGGSSSTNSATQISFKLTENPPTSPQNLGSDPAGQPTPNPVSTPGTPPVTPPGVPVDDWRRSFQPIPYFSSVGLVIPVTSLTLLENGSYRVTREPLEHLVRMKSGFHSFPVCADEVINDRFKIVGARGTGTLVTTEGQDQFVTARHVTSGIKIDEYAAVLDYRKDQEIVAPQNVVFFKDFAHSHSSLGGIADRHLDFAKINLTEPIDRRFIAPIPWNTSQDMFDSQPLAMFGYPNASSLYIDHDIVNFANEPMVIKSCWAKAVTLDGSEYCPLALTSTDSYHGNSGSPLVDITTGQMVGMLVSGADDYDFGFTDEGDFCAKSFVVRDLDNVVEQGISARFIHDAMAVDAR